MPDSPPPDNPAGIASDLEADLAMDLVAAGDGAARSGQWPEAIDAWARAIAASDDARAANRIQWFLRQTTPADAGDRSPWHFMANPVMVGVIAACLGTACVLIAQPMSGEWSHLLAVLAWGCYGISAVAGIRYAYGHGRPRNEPATAAAIQRARQVAQTLATGSDTIAAGPGHHL